MMMRKLITKVWSYKTLFYGENNVTSHESYFFEKYVMLYNLLENLVTSKINIDNANAEQISFIINVMQEYNKNDLLDNETRKKKSIFVNIKF